MSDEAIEAIEEVVDEPKEIIPDGLIKKEDAQRDFNVQYKKANAESRAKDEAIARAGDLERRVKELEAASVDTTIPPVPDPLAENYTELVTSRDEAIQRKAKHDFQQASDEAELDKTRMAQAETQKEKDDALVATFDSNMVKHGLIPVEVIESVKFLMEAGISDSFQNVLLEDIDGPLMVNYLFQNPQEIETLKGMGSLALVRHLDTEIRKKASLLKPKTSTAPDPPMTLQGGGVAELQEPWEKGAHYE